MNGKLLMSLSSLFLGITGLAATFAPQELLGAMGQQPNFALSLLVQLLGALLCAFAATNWMSRENMIGGIYNRPLGVGNVTHFTVGALTLIKVLMAGHVNAPLIAAAVIYSLLAIAFTRVVFFWSPVKGA